MKPIFPRSLIGLAVATTLWSSASLATPSLTGFSSDSTIPYSLFEDTETVNPWIKPAPAKNKPLKPATTNHVKQMQQLKQLQQSLSEQQRINQEVLAGHQVEKQALQQQLAALSADQATVETQRQQLVALQQELAHRENQHTGSQQQLNDLRLLLAAHQLQVDTHTLQQSTLADKLKEKEQVVIALSNQLEAERVEKQALQDQVVKPDAAQLAELKQHQDKIAELQITLLEAEDQRAALREQLTKQQAMQLSAAPESHEQKLSYANGVAFASNIVQSLRAQQNLGVEPDRPMVLAGIKDAFSQRVALNSDEVAKLVTELDGTLNDKLQQQQKTQAAEREKQLKAGKALIEKTKQRKGVKTLDGAYYVVSKAGKGEKLNAESTVDILLTGRLPDGTVFDSSGKDNKVQRVKLDSLLPALTKVLSQLQKGSQVEVILPAEKAFGDAGVENLIPAGATLIFDIKINS
ncbi:FKBP-type peptidyl-prolyl cis-trans isomerase [Pantoea sp.]|uniref:FKBP-type peptidyl-prolyl cis-trans isomerase n=1 Tax=Pantoea sp. TaxID=69393 RepID=UPI0031D863D2